MRSHSWKIAEKQVNESDYTSFVPYASNRRIARRISPLAGKPARQSILVNIPKLISSYYTNHPDPSEKSMLVEFGTSGLRQAWDRNQGGRIDEPKPLSFGGRLVPVSKQSGLERSLRGGENTRQQCFDR